MQVNLDSQSHSPSRSRSPPRPPPRPPLLIIVQVLSLEDNALTSWSEVQRLAALPSLARLHLSNNPLADVRYALTPFRQSSPDASKPEDAAHSGSSSSSSLLVPFAQLQCLLLGQCGLADWGQVNELGLFPSLKDLRITGEAIRARVISSETKRRGRNVRLKTKSGCRPFLTVTPPNPECHLSSSLPSRQPGLVSEWLLSLTQAPPPRPHPNALSPVKATRSCL